MSATRPPGSAAARRLQAVADALNRSVHLLAVRDGVIGALPLTLVASVFLLVAQPPIPGLQALVDPYLPLLLLPFKMLTKVIALYVCFGVGHSLAKRYSLDPLAGGLLSIACLLTSTSPALLANGPDGKPMAGFGLQSELLGPSGIFPALVLSVFAVEIQRVMVQRKLVIKLPPSVPEPIIQSFVSILPAWVTVTLTWLVVHVLGFDLHQAVVMIARPLVSAGDTYLGMVGIALIDSCFWLMGVHPSAVLSVAKPVWFQMIQENASAVSQGLAAPHIAPRETYLAFIWFGGSGGTMSLPFLMWRAKSAQLRAIARAGLIPAMFNINEPILFGAPIVMNRALALPFIAGPLVSVTLTWAALRLGLVRPPSFEFVWTVPAPIGALWTTGGDWRAAVLVLCNIACSALIFWPFIRRYDHELAEKEAAAATPPPGN